MSSSSQTKNSQRVPVPSQASVALLYKLCQRLKPMMTSTTYLSQQQLHDLGVKCTELDFDTGIPADGGPRFLQLASLEHIETLAKENNLIEHCSVNTSFDTYDSWHTMRAISYFYDYNLFALVPKTDKYTASDQDMPHETVLDHSPWKYSDHVTINGLRWGTYFALKLKDNSEPDMICFLGNINPLDDEKIYISELWCIARFSCNQLSKKEHRHNQTASVTLVSGSGRSLRVVQGYVDTNDQSVVLRKSAVIELRGDDENNFQKLLQVCRWFLAQPCKKQLSHLEEPEIQDNAS
ncbi:uncharacterized protein F4812DRAFT_465679 [Daldinia caldariorum]|uniref:uncharacterized protein n=1 Tax=Daldinia caldariorum TaxID=326644 RepID=UPI002008C231|nr:uncharacterized protein F4812DRAFT_465679 [Daldinia caldariorum]KAI1466367.1 hypothetical protein F4812DRAFT_465679 [Daldinia caldariorum]